MGSKYNWCEKCRCFHWDGENHLPLFYFKHEDWGDDWQEIRAMDFKDAAEKFATDYNEDGDYALMDSEVDVIIFDGTDEKIFTVGAEPDIRYWAEEK